MRSFVFLLILVAVGCNREAPIVTYVVPTSVPAALKPQQTRMVAAILPDGDQAWFFKVSGPKTAVDSVAETFRKFVTDIKFEEGKPVLTDLPADWKRGGERSMRFATIDINTSEKQLDLSVSQLTKMDQWPSLVSANVNRWRGQVGLPESEAPWAEAAKLDREDESADEPAIWVDLTGTPDTNTPSMMPPMAMQASTDAADPHAGLPREAQAEVEAARKRGGMSPLKTAEQPKPKDEPTEEPPLKYDAPEDWRPGRMSTMRMAAFNVGPESAPAEVTVIAAGGDLRGNVARWMGQVIGSEPDDAAVDKMLTEAEKRTVSGRDAQRFVLLPDKIGGGDEASAIDATIVPLEEGFSLFVKMTGPADVVGEQTAAMGTFLDSLQLKQ